MRAHGQAVRNKQRAVGVQQTCIRSDAPRENVWGRVKEEKKEEGKEKRKGKKEGTKRRDGNRDRSNQLIVSLRVQYAQPWSTLSPRAPFITPAVGSVAWHPDAIAIIIATKRTPVEPEESIICLSLPLLAKNGAPASRNRAVRKSSCVWTNIYSDTSMCNQSKPNFAGLFHNEPRR